MAKRFTVQKRARMRTNGWERYESHQFQWDATEYAFVGDKPFRPAKTPKTKRAKRVDMVPLSGGAAPRRAFSPVFYATDWANQSRIGEIVRR